MRLSFRGGFAALAGLLFLSASVEARRIAPAPIPDRVARAEAVVVGKVTAIEAKPIKTPDGAEYAVAVVKVDEALFGPKGLTHIKIGFQPGTGGRFPNLNLKVGQEACFFVSRQPGQDFYTWTYYFDVIGKEELQGELATIKRWTKVLADPEAALKAKDANERFVAVAFLVKHYRTPRGGVKTAELSADLSKQILETLAAAEWDKFNPEIRTNAQGVFLQLGLTPAEGWNLPKDFQQVPELAKQWLKVNAAKHRIKYFVREESKE